MLKNIYWTMLKLGNLIRQVMKKIIYCVIIALIAISCDNSDPFGNSSENAPIIIPKTCFAQTPLPESKPLAGSKTRAIEEIQAESWDEVETPATRTYAVVDPANASEYFQYWSPGDAISLFFTTKNLQYQMQSHKDGDLDIGIFELVGEASQGTALNTGYYYSVYPYKEETSINRNGRITYNFPSTQHYNGDSYANGENGMVAIEPMHGTDSVLYFQNFCSYLQLRMVSDEGNPKSVRKITLVANDENDMAGEGTIEISDVPVVKMKKGATSQITLDCGSGVELSQDEKNPSRFWFVLPGDFTFTNGFSITVVFTDNSFFKKSTSKAFTIARSHIKPFATFKPSSEEPNGSIRYKYNDTSINEPYPLKDGIFFGENGEPLDIVNQVFDETTNEWVILLSGTLKTIGGNAFKGPGPDIEYIKVDNEESIDISDFAFYNCTADFIEINNDINEINKSSFTGSTVKDLNINGNVTVIKKDAGTGSSIESIKITGDVDIIEEQAFSGCDKLQTINVGNVESIGYRAFYMCGNLTKVNIPGVKYIDMDAFRECSNLETITLESVITIDDAAFMDCSKLTSAVISENCTMIGEGAFCRAKNLQEVYCYAVNPPFIKTDNPDGSYVFDEVHPDICVYIPMGSWGNYTDDEYFVGHDYEDPNIDAETNWWYEEYENILCEIED